MARPKPKQNKVKKVVFQDPEVENLVEVEIEFICPKRGKIKQKVKMKKLKSVKVQTIKRADGQIGLDDLDKDDDGLSMYGNTEG